MDEPNLSPKKYSLSSYLQFIIPSIIGVLILMVPFQYQGETTIVVALLASKLTSATANILPAIVLIFITITGIITLLHKLFKPSFIEDNEFLKGIFDVSIFWVLTRLVGMVLGFLVYFNIGPEWIYSEFTGGLILYDLILTLFSMFLFAGFLLPFLTDFGLLEFVGSILTPLMRPVFTLPGRSSIDCIASWVGDGTIGVTLTNRQYQQGYYTAREASVIATTFSAVSITFSLVVLSQVDLMEYFGVYYLTIIICGVVAALILPKIPPLSRKKDVYYTENKMDTGEDIPEGFTTIQWGTKLAIEKAKKTGNPKDFVVNGTKIVFDMWLGVLPAIMAFGTIALIVAENTQLFVWLGTPFIPILNLFNVPFATEAAQTMVVGFADMFLPSVIGASIPSEMTRFIIATLSVTQLVYLSEAGAVILGAKIPVGLKDLFFIFIERTLVTLPIIILVAHIIF
ncbi:MAG: YjiH family protein [Senegalia sp. (in: firmicutes)]|uniref:YjiH family protein n=1 Tax=Senegalia sp. (in: firmicutes) TaxID=1924098 RepID=UPI003F985D77